MEEKFFESNCLVVLYNTYGRFIHFIRKEEKIDGDVLFFELDTEEKVDLENYAINGYKMLRETGSLINHFKKYTVKELRDMEESFDNLDEKKKEIQSEFLVDLNWIMDRIEANKYNYDMDYPVEQIEIRYSEVLEDYIFLYVSFDHIKKKFTYMDMSTGLPVDKEILDLYTFYPRDEILKKDTYTPRETIELRVQLNKGVRSLGRRM